MWWPVSVCSIFTVKCHHSSGLHWMERAATVTVHPYPLSPYLCHVSWLTSRCQHQYPFAWTCPLAARVYSSYSAVGWKWWGINILKSSPQAFLKEWLIGGVDKKTQLPLLMENLEACVPYWPQQAFATVVLSGNLLDNSFFTGCLPKPVSLPYSLTDVYFLGTPPT